ncbi:MAG: glycosyltransferase [Pseudomonadota bacterium]
MPAIPKRVLPRGDVAALEAIPAIIHQTFETAEVPQGMYDAAMGWVDQNPGFEYRFADSDDRRALIAERFTADALAAYDTLENGAFKADFWRLCVLIAEGGVYADLDTVCLVPLAGVLPPEARFVASAAGLSHAVSNMFLAAAPNHPFLKAALAYAVACLRDPDPEFDGFHVTGPGALGVAINGVLGRDARAAHPSGRRGEGALAFEIWPKFQATNEMPRHVAADGTPVFLTDYPGYKTDLAAAGQQHWTETKPSRAPLARLRRAARRVGARLSNRN